MAKLLCLFVLALTLSVVYTKHIHPRSIVHGTDNEGLKIQSFDENRVPIAIIEHIKPSRFVPLNNEAYFKIFPPCEEGFERDVLGICREVWY